MAKSISLLTIEMMCEKCADDTKLKHNDVNVSSAFVFSTGEKQRCESCKKMHNELYEVAVFNMIKA